MNKVNGRRVLVIGLDGVSPKLLFERWPERVPNIRKLMEQGIYGRHDSIIPPTTIMAWSAFASGMHPGQLGVYAYMIRESFDSFERRLADSTLCKKEFIWDILGGKGANSTVLHVPLTFPVRPIKGAMVSGFLAPELNEESVHPKELLGRVKERFGDKYLFDIAGLAGYKNFDPETLIKKTYEMAGMQFSLAEELLKKQDWAFFMHVDIGTDRLHHMLWRYFDDGHVNYEPGTKYANALADYYSFVDGKIGGLVRHADDDTVIIIASDHGMDRMDGKINVNEWLIKEGYLKLKEGLYESLDGPTKFSYDMIDWEKTKAFSQGNYQARIFFNRKERDPGHGILIEEEFLSLREELTGKLRKITDPKGKKLNTFVYTPEEIYGEDYEKRDCPDLLIMFDDLVWGTSDEIGTRQLYSWDTIVGKNDAGHAREGFFIISGKPVKRRGDVGKTDFLNFFPTIMKVFGLEDNVKNGEPIKLD